MDDTSNSVAQTSHNVTQTEVVTPAGEDKREAASEIIHSVEETDVRASVGSYSSKF